MDANLAKIWNNVLSDIEKEVTKANFLTLFKNTSLISLENATAIIATPSPMITNLIQKRFPDLIKTALDKYSGKSIMVSFVSGNIPSQNPSDQGPLFAQVSSEQKPLSIGHLPRVRPDYTFENMAVSSSNQLAFVSATTVAKNLGQSYNPLFVYGPVGVGKTHLMQAIANFVYEQDPSRKIIYITSEEFTNEVVEAIKTNDTGKMKRRFRSAALLLIDDIQFIEGKERVQEELFHTFNILIDNGRQIVLSSDRPPDEIKKLEKRLSSRFAGGLTVDIEPPDFELKTAVILIKAKKYEVDLPIEVAKLIVEKVQDIRSLEGFLLRVITEAKTRDLPITQELTAKTLKIEPTSVSSTHHHPEDVIQSVCKYFQIKPTLLKGPKRDASLVKARQISMYILKVELGLTHAEVGNLLGGRDHTTVMHGVEKVENLLKTRGNMAEDIRRITQTLTG